MKKLGIIAGSGRLPQDVINACEEQGRPYFVIAIKDNADKSLSTPYMCWVRIGAVGEIFDLLHQQKVQEIVMIGGIRRPTISTMCPDWRTVKFFAKAGVQSLGDDGLLKAVISEVEKEGFCVIGADEILQDRLSKKGIYGKVKPSANQIKDIAKGFKVAKILGQADVGQSVIVSEGLILGVEAIEGTDALIERCDALRCGVQKSILVKVKKPNQERRIDLPTIGVKTVENAKRFGLAGIAVEQGCAFVVQEKVVIEKADQLGLFLIGIDESCLKK